MNSSCSAWTFIPCDFSCDNKYRRWFICLSILSTYTEVERVDVISNPSNVACVNRSMSDKGGGILRCLEAGRWKTISLVLSELMVSRFLADQEQMLSHSCWMSMLADEYQKSATGVDEMTAEIQHCVTDHATNQSGRFFFCPTCTSYTTVCHARARARCDVECL